MKFHVLTLFPEMVMQGLHTSIIGRAVEKNLLSIDAVNIRDFTTDKHGKVDDYTYGGGAGMLMQAQPVYDAYKSVCGNHKVRTIYVTPQGVPFQQKLAMELAKEEELIFLCGHYEGIDERVLEEVVTDYISIGDYVLTGGELPAMVMIDAISRLVPGVLNNDQSAETETFHRDLLEYPQYSRPEIWHEKPVPKVLLSGNHKLITGWRLEQSKERTQKNRPDLYEKYRQKEELVRKLAKNKRIHIHMMESLTRGYGEIIYTEGTDVLIYDENAGVCMIKADLTVQPEKWTLLIPKMTRWVVCIGSDNSQILQKELQLKQVMQCYQMCYTKKETLPICFKDIKPLRIEDLPYVSRHYDVENEDYLRERIQKGALYGVYVEEKLVGFMGIHREGSMGMLYVDPDYRRRHIGESLEAYVINRQLENGYIPYGQVETGNEISRKMQEKLGLYEASDCIYWLQK